MAAIPAWVYWVSVAVGAAGSVYSGQKQAKRLEANARIFEENSRLREQQTLQQERTLRQRLSGIIGEQTVAYSKAGVSMAGTPIMVSDATLAEGERDIVAVKYQGMLEANRWKQQAAFAREDAQTTKVSSALQAVGGLFGSAARFQSMQPIPKEGAADVTYDASGARSSKSYGYKVNKGSE